MGSGKSYWGAILAHHLNMPFIDLDLYIEAQEAMSISQYFETQGEAIFREIERFHLHELQNHPASVIAVGGGTPCFFDNMDWMNRQGKTVYLKCDPGLLAQRLKGEMHKRPLLKKLSVNELHERIFYMLIGREPFYNKAQTIVEIPGSGISIHELLRKILPFNQSECASKKVD